MDAVSLNGRNQEGTNLMNYASSIALAAAMVWLTGCASTSNVTVLAPIGPAPGERPSNHHDGFLRVYSAREPAVIDPDAEEFFWNNDFGRREFLHQAAHTDYTIYAQDGRALKHVRNARELNDPNPALVRLPPGQYKVQAQADDYDTVTFEAVVPVVIKPGQTTEAHLEPQWTPATPYNTSDVVCLPNGTIAGWRAVDMATARP
jgi:hypothetical protein